MIAHPAADIFPLVVGPDFDALVADIRDHGQRDPIVTYEGKILDGRHRWAACERLKVEPVTKEWDGKGTPEDFVISKNLHRRHLSESQRAMVAKKLANMRQGERTDREPSANLPKVSQEKAAELLHVSPRSVRHAGVVLDKGAPELVAAVQRGDIPVSTAAQIVHLPKDRQDEIAKGGKKEAAKVARRFRIRQAGRAEPVHRVLDPEFQAEADAAARDLEIERDERIALAGAGELAAENERLTRQVSLLDKRVATLLEENRSLKYREQMWRERAIAAGWKAQADA